jgi:hypothetical protein
MKAPVLTLLLVAAVLCAGGASSSAATQVKTHKVTLYSVATQVQYLSNADDEARGQVNNPFDPETNKLKPSLSLKGSGPFAGDVTIYSFNLFPTSSLKHSNGTADYTCYYNYDRKALCTANYQLKGATGTLVASGPVDFDASRFTLVVTGGTSKYLGARGELLEHALAGKNGQRLDFVLVG